MKLSVHFSSASTEWATPEAVYQGLHAEFDFTLDPCPLGGTVDGTSPDVQWAGRRVFCNPPYGPGIRPFLDRALEADIAVFLLPARTDTKWFHEVVLPHAQEIRFLRGRLKFGQAKNSAPFPSMIVIFAKQWRPHGTDTEPQHVPELWERGGETLADA
jgi:DNA N-6-adenine-methyltransferase (Dam)